MLYFAYGSNMSTLRLSERVPSARFETVAQLPGHQLRFHKAGRDGSAKCDAALTADPDHQVIGVVFRIDPLEKTLLDRAEDLGRGYGERTVMVTGNCGRTLQVFTYYALQIDSSLRPYRWYLEHVLHGAREHALPEHYIRHIDTIESITDPQAHRHASEMAIYG